MSMSGRRLMFRCFFCRNKFERDDHLYHGNLTGYHGKYVGRYMIEVCDECYAGNSDGWTPPFESPLLAHLTEKGLPIPDRNKEGRLPRD